MSETKTIWTIGHSTRSFEEFIDILKSFQIRLVADIRNFPGSKRYPHFNKAALEINLPLYKIEYHHFKELGGRRKPQRDSKNTGWRHPAFRGYADYMESSEFKNAMEELQSLAQIQRVVYMCSEAVWWRCHRSLVSDYLKNKNWTVCHIMAEGKSKEHTYTGPAKIEGGVLRYD